MMTKVLRRVILVTGAAMSLAWQPITPLTSAPIPPAKVAAAAWGATQSGQSDDMIITVPGYPDLTPARELPSKEAKTLFVFEALTRYADRAQASLRRDLDAHRIAYQVLWISNSIAVPAMDRPTLLRLATRTDVSHIDLDVKTPGIQTHSDQRLDTATSLFTNDRWAVKAPQTVEWGVARVNAPQAWAIGYTGQGIVLADLDTGVMWNHSALITKYRGWNGITATHDYNWFDTIITGSVPVDPFVIFGGHGTHTVGTMVGDDGAGHQVGVAPGAKWIACRNMDDTGNGSVSRYTTCFQFAMAPTRTDGTGADPRQSADITSNSWTCLPVVEDRCNEPSALVTVTQALNYAGIMVVAAAGNSGCTGINQAPGTLDQAFTVGAIDLGNNIAPFSSVGPSSLTGKVKPNIVAPGVSVLSSINTGGFGTNSGTSMATPHIAGVTALLWSAASWLRGDVAETQAVITSTAKPLTMVPSCNGISGSSVPNNYFGYGLVDAQAAISDARALVPQAVIPHVVDITQQITVSYYLTNTSALTRSNVVLTASIPVSASVLSYTSGGIRAGQDISWTVGDMVPGQGIVTILVLQPIRAGWISSSVVASYDGITARRYVPGADVTGFVSSTQIRLLVVMRS